MILFLAVIRDGKKMRGAIKAAVASKPGINKKELCERLDVAWNTIRHHINVLQRHGTVHVENRGWEHELYPTSAPTEHRVWLRALHDDDSAAVLESVFCQPGIGVYQLSEELGFSRKVIRTHLSRFLEDGLIRKVGSARPRYKPIEPPPGLDPFMRHSGADGYNELMN